MKWLKSKMTEKAMRKPETEAHRLGFNTNIGQKSVI